MTAPNDPNVNAPGGNPEGPRTPDAPAIDDRAMATAHATMVTLWDQEANRFWVRNNLMLVANGLLLGAAVAADQSWIIRILMCCFGIYFTTAWLLMNSKGGYYLSRWRPVIEAFEKEMKRQPSFPILPLTEVRPDGEAIAKLDWRQITQVLRGNATPRADAGKLMHFVILGFLVAYLGLGAFYLASVQESEDEVSRAERGLTRIRPESRGNRRVA